MTAARNAEELGILPSAGMQGQGMAVAEAGVEVSPFGSSTILKGRERVQADMENALSEMITNFCNMKCTLCSTREANTSTINTLKNLTSN